MVFGTSSARAAHATGEGRDVPTGMDGVPTGTDGAPAGTDCAPALLENACSLPQRGSCCLKAAPGFHNPRCRSCLDASVGTRRIWPLCLTNVLPRNRSR